MAHISIIGTGDIVVLGVPYPAVADRLTDRRTQHPFSPKEPA